MNATWNDGFLPGPLEPPLVPVDLSFQLPKLTEPQLTAHREVQIGSLLDGEELEEEASGFQRHLSEKQLR